ncbi:MAG: sugar phosphate isomerase/epimerase [Gemmataceae bacterium]|nr:sugar phosphate isomerase/epimerase [Gemmataceae bacterium]MDW8241773.1 TIM barrel protein [Thermogemmata sp.]
MWTASAQDARRFEPSSPTATSTGQPQVGQSTAPDVRKTRFLIACMTLPYARFPLIRALKGIQAAGYHYVAWGTTHREENGQQVPVLAPDDPPAKAKELASRCRDLGLEPILMFSMVYPEAPQGLEVLTQRIKQAGTAGVQQVLTFGHTKGGNRKLWIERFKALAPIAKDHNVTVVIKQHGGETGTGEACAAITREIADPHIKVNYDAGNVLDYLGKDPIADIRTCVDEIRSFCIKDHRLWPKKEDCGPGFGEIDHYRLLHPVAFTGLTMPLACENISAPLLPRPDKPEEVDVLARRAREFLEWVVQGLQLVPVPRVPSPDPSAPSPHSSGKQ